jgi:hypothetical protein
MKSNSGAILGLTMLAGLLTAAPARAEDAPASCEVPDYLLTSESALPKVADAVKNGRPLDILVVGSRSSTINTTEGSAYPGRLQAVLREKLPSITVNVSVELQSLLWLSGRPAPSMLCGPSIPMTFAVRSTKELLHCKMREPTWS